MGVDAQSASRLAGGGDVVRVTSESRDVALDPFERVALIVEAVVAANTIRQDAVAKKADTVGNVDGDDGFVGFDGAFDKARVVC